MWFLSPHGGQEVPSLMAVSLIHPTPLTEILAAAKHLSTHITPTGNDKGEIFINIIWGMRAEGVFILRAYCCNGCLLSCFPWFLLVVSHCCTSKSSSDLRKRGKTPKPQFPRCAHQKGFRRRWPGADSRLSSENPQILPNPFCHSGILGI